MTDNSVLVVSWDPPAYDMQNGVITRYTLSCTNSNGEPLDLTLSSPQTIYLGVFTPLSMYSCTISASTIVGPGPLATASVTVPGKECYITPSSKQFSFFAELNGVQVYLPFIPLDLLEYSDIVQLPETDDGFSDGIPLAPSGVPFGDSNQTTAYVTQKYVYGSYTNLSIIFRLALMACCPLGVLTTASSTSLSLVTTFVTWWLHSGMTSTSREATEISSI